MKTRISALADGELDDHELRQTFDAITRSAELRGQWNETQLIGAALRDEPKLDFDVTSRVMAALEQEPTVLAPRAQGRKGWWRPALAVAASFAGVATVSILALDSGNQAAHQGQVARTRDAAATLAARNPAVQSTPRLQEYLVAHQAHAFGPVDGGARNIRTVAVVEAR